MNLYLAAVHSNDMAPGQAQFEKLREHQRSHVLGAEHILESYHYFQKQTLLDAARNNGRKVFLDSGAFSAWTQGVTINIKDYVDFIFRNIDIILMPSVLDSIGDPYQTYLNQKEMERLGVRALPCFHFGEDVRYCDYYANDYDYITLGGMVGKSTADLIKWLDVVWERHLLDGAGKPRTKVHAFGITSVPVMERYPWYSVDSSSWVQVSSFGNVMDPDYGVIRVSDGSPSRKIEGQHVDNFSEIERAAILRRFEALGYDYEELRTSYAARRAYCMWAYTELNRRINLRDRPFVAEQPGLF